MERAVSSTAADAVATPATTRTRKIAAVYQLELTQSTRDAYRARLRHLIAYLRRTDPEIVIDDDTIDVKRFHIDQFLLFLLDQQDKHGLSFTALEGYRAALFYAFKEARVEFPVAFAKKLKQFYRGLHRKEAQERQDGLRPLNQGKDPMPHTLYVCLCEYFIRQGNVFAWAYLTMAWNSMCRTKSVAGILITHLEPLQDALGLFIPKSKADQIGRRSKVPWHVFANPSDVRQCPITALGALLLLDELRNDDDALFLGGSQERRFAKHLQTALASSSAAQSLLNGRAISPHSTRKGSVVYASNGTTHAPSFTAVALRGGWSVGDVLGRYFRYDYAMDAFLGRILAGLDVSSPAFAVLPPHFRASPTASENVIRRCFPAFSSRPASSLGVLRFVLPSLVHHYNALLRFLPQRHPLRSATLFTDTGLRQSLEDVLVTGIASPYIKATGIPPHVLLLQKLELLTAAAKPNEETDSSASEEDLPVGPPVDEAAAALPSVGPLAAWRLLLRGDKQRGLPPFRLLKPTGTRNQRKLLSAWMFFYKVMLQRLGGLPTTSLTALAMNDDEQLLNELFLKAWNSFEFPAASAKWKITTVVRKLRETQ